MEDRMATQLFEIRTILIDHMVTPAIIDAIMRDIKRAITNGPCSWAFKPDNSFKRV
jgi:hypothetical protein